MFLHKCSFIYIYFFILLLFLFFFNCIVIHSQFENGCNRLLSLCHCCVAIFIVTQNSYILFFCCCCLVHIDWWLNSFKMVGAGGLVIWVERDEDGGFLDLRMADIILIWNCNTQNNKYHMNVELLLLMLDTVLRQTISHCICASIKSILYAQCTHTHTHSSHTCRHII